MILVMSKEGIEIKQNSLENVNHMKIHLEFKDVNLTSKDFIQIFINNKPLEKVDKNTFRLNYPLYDDLEKELTVSLVNEKGLHTYKKMINLNRYVSFGNEHQDKLPQVYLDLINELKELEKRVKYLENKTNGI